ncbi:MAG: hypothetical protein V4670_12295 [Bacteroidota bacterium]
MYQISKLTGVIKKNGIVVIQDDRMQDWNDFVAYNGVIEYVDSFDEEIEEIENSKIALHVQYPELSGRNYQLIMLDKLPNIKRRESFSNRGLKGKYEYEKNGQLIWSIETKHWFEVDTDFPEGLKKIVKLYNVGGEVIDEWFSCFSLTADGKQTILKQQRELILSYFKGRQPELFNLLYAFFATEINTYVATGDKQSFENTLVNAAAYHDVQIVRDTLTSVITSESNTQITVLQGILYELV